MAASSLRGCEDGAVPFASGYMSHGVMGRFRERFSSPCDACLADVQPCQHAPELPLRMMMSGHNPSLHAWGSGYMYSNPSNNMWPLLSGTFGGGKVAPWDGIVPSHWPITGQDLLPLHAGVGLTDLGLEPGNDAASYSGATLAAWRAGWIDRMRGHMRRVGATMAQLQQLARQSAADTSSTSSSGSGGSGDGGSSAGTLSGHKRKRSEASSAAEAADSSSSSSSTGSGERMWNAAAAGVTSAQALRLLTQFLVARGITADPRAPDTHVTTPEACAPLLVAFTGKAQWKAMFSPPLTCAVESGLQPGSHRPADWPFPPSTRVFVLPSSSGRAAFTLAARKEPYAALAALVHSLPWLGGEDIASLESEPRRLQLAAGTRSDWPPVPESAATAAAVKKAASPRKKAKTVDQAAEAEEQERSGGATATTAAATAQLLQRFTYTPSSASEPKQR